MTDNPGVRVPPYISQQVTRSHRFYLDVEQPHSRRLQVVCGGWEEVSADYVIDRADFPYFALEFVLGGRGTVELSPLARTAQRHREAAGLAGREVQTAPLDAGRGGVRRSAVSRATSRMKGDTPGDPLEPGVVFTYGPDWEQRIVTDPQDRLLKYFVNFVGQPASELLRECGLAPGRVVRVAPILEVREAFDQLIRLASHPTRTTPRKCALQLELLFLLLSDRTAALSSAPDRSREAFERCRTVAEAEFLRMKTARELADRGHVDVAYLCRLFQRYAGTSPYRYLHRLKMAWAAERLHAGGTLVRHVADELGIDPFQFSRGFKRVHGLAPSAFQTLRAGRPNISDPSG